MGPLVKLVVLALCALVAGNLFINWRDDAATKPPLMLFSSLPLLWEEQEDIAATLNSNAPPPWVRSQLEADYALLPINSMMAQAGLGGAKPNPLQQGKLLLIAQPRSLAPAEFAALDEWLRDGGKALFFADPLSTWPSRFMLGDRRRPADTVLLSPLLTRWGLQLTMDEDVDAAEAEITLPGGGVLKLNQFGRFALLPAGGQPGDACDLAADGVLARCTIGKGRITLVADVAALEPDAQPFASGVDALIEMAFE